MSDAMQVTPSGKYARRMQSDAYSEIRAHTAACATASIAGFFFAFRTVAVFISARWLNIGTEPGVLLTFACSAVLVLAAAIQGFGRSAQPIRSIWTAGPFRWVLIFVALSGCSFLWTGAASRSNSALYWLALAADVILVLLVIRGSDHQHAAHSIMQGFIWGACLLAALAWMLPPEEDLRLGDLEYFNTNQIGNLCALAIFLCLLLASRSQGKWRIATTFLTITLFRSLSKSTLVAFVTAQAFRLVVDREMSRRSKVLVVLCAVALSLAFWGLVDAYLNIYTNAGNQTETLTGRTAIWAWSLNAAMKRPWLGNGIDAMWKVTPPFGAELFEARHTENELLQQFFAYGVVGVAVLIGVYTSLWQRFRRMANVSERSVLMSLMVFIVVRGVAEAEPFDLLLPLWLITTICLLEEPNAHQRLALSSPRPPQGKPSPAGPMR